MGVRKDFQNRTVESVAVAPIYASSSFGVATETWARIVAQYESEVVAELQEAGFRVIAPEELRATLEANGGWEAFSEVVDFRHGIDVYFEPELHDRTPREVTLMSQLSAAGKFPAATLLVTEIVYQSSGQCAADARDHTERAEVWAGERPARGSLEPSPCVVSHFQAKLVDARTGHTMWHNRRLRELRVPKVSLASRLENVSATVEDTVGGEHGLGPFAPTTQVKAAAGL